jgi:hypothetical protein
MGVTVASFSRVIAPVYRRAAASRLRIFCALYGHGRGKITPDGLEHGAVTWLFQFPCLLDA